MIKSPSVVRLQSLFRSFLLLGAGVLTFSVVLDGRLGGSAVGQSLSMAGSQSAGEETPVTPAARPAGPRLPRRICSGTPLLFGAPWWMCQAEAPSAHFPLPSPSRLLLVSVDVLASFSPSPFNLRLCGCPGVSVASRRVLRSSLQGVGSSLTEDRTQDSCLRSQEACIGSCWTAGEAPLMHLWTPEIYKHFICDGTPLVLCALVNLSQFYTFTITLI